MAATTEANRWIKRWRWHLADLLNRSRRFCWADLVTWVMRTHEGEEGYRLRDATNAPRRCGQGSDYERNGCCYCGKFMTDELRKKVGLDA